MDDLVSVLINFIELAINYVDPEPLVVFDPKEVAVYSRFLFFVVAGSVIYSIFRNMFDNQNIAVVLALIVAFMGTAAWPDDLAILLIIWYAFLSRLVEGIAIGYSLFSLVGGLKNRGYGFRVSILPLVLVLFVFEFDPQIYTIMVLIIGFISMVNLLKKIESPLASDAAIFSLAVLVNFGIVAAPSLGSEIGTLIMYAFPAGLVIGALFSALYKK